MAQDGGDDLFRRGMEAAIAASRTPDGAQRDLLLEEAEAAFQSILVAQPELPRPRLELARILFLQGEDRLAKEHFERVLADEVQLGADAPEMGGGRGRCARCDGDGARPQGPRTTAAMPGSWPRSLSTLSSWG